MSTNSDLTAANASGTGGTGESVKYITDGADTYGADPETGVQALTLDPSNPNIFAREGSNGDTFVGEPLSPPHGFLTRPQGWDR